MFKDPVSRKGTPVTGVLDITTPRRGAQGDPLEAGIFLKFQVPHGDFFWQPPLEVQKSF